MDNPLSFVIHAKVGERILFRVRIQGFNLKAGYGIVYATSTIRRRDIVICHDEICRHTPRLAPGKLQSFKSLWAGDFMQEMPVDVQDRRAVLPQ